MSEFAKIVSSQIRPQDDFYAYVNQKWISRAVIPNDMARWGSFVELREDNLLKLRKIVIELTQKKSLKPGSIEQKVRDFYLSGRSQLQVEKTGLAELGELNRKIDKISNVTEMWGLVGELHQLSIGIFWQCYIEPNEKKSTVYSLRLNQGGLSLPSRDYYLSTTPEMRKIQQGLVAHMAKLFTASKYSLASTNAPQRIYGFEKDLAKQSMSPTELRDVEALYNKFSFRELGRLSPKINWARYFEGLGTTPPAYLVVNQPNYFKYLNQVIAKADINLLKTYLKWQALRTAAPYLGERLSKENFKFYGHLLQGIPAQPPLWKRQINAIDNYIGEALGQLYIDRHFPPEAKARMEVLVRDLKKAFAGRINQIEWMEPKTKKYALHKLGKIRVKIGHPNRLLKYGHLKISPDSYFGNVLKSERFHSRRELAKLKRPVDRKVWWMSPPTVNAYYDPNTNEMAFPAGILQPPFFDFKAEDALNYGGIGSVIGHELTHGFDDQGSLFDAEGNTKTWWSAREAAKFKQRAQVMVKQADDFEALPGEHLKGQLTLGENIADLGGAEIAYQAFGSALSRLPRSTREDDLSAQQKFFLNLALTEKETSRSAFKRQMLLTDPHSPGKFRINNTFKNMAAFHEAFELKPGDKLYLAPAQRAQIW